MYKPTEPIDRETIFNITVFVEGFLLLVATIWSFYAQIALVAKLQCSTHDIGYGAFWGVVMAITGVTAVWLGRFKGPFNQLREITYEHLAPLFSQLSYFDLLGLALLSGFAEEILFRGVIQSEIGLVSTAFIFGLFHCPNRYFISYGLWVFAAGLLLGWLMQATGTLWVPITAHMVSNLLSLIFLKYFIKQAPTKTTEP